MATLSVDFRQRILAAYDEGGCTREDVAKRFRVSVGMVKKLLQQRRHLGDLAPQHHRAGRKPKILPEHLQKIEAQLGRKVDSTLVEMRSAAGLDCSLVAIHYAVAKLGLTYKKKHCAPASKTDPKSLRRGKAGTVSKGALIRPNSSSSTSQARKPI